MGGRTLKQQETVMRFNIDVGVPLTQLLNSNGFAQANGGRHYVWGVGSDNGVYRATKRGNVKVGTVDFLGRRAGYVFKTSNPTLLKDIETLARGTPYLTMDTTQKRQVVSQLRKKGYSIGRSRGLMAVYRRGGISHYVRSKAYYKKILVGTIKVIRPGKPNEKYEFRTMNKRSKYVADITTALRMTTAPKKTVASASP